MTKKTYNKLVRDLIPDSIVKKMLGRKGSSIFEVPCRKAVYVTTKEESRSVNIQTLGKSFLSKTGTSRFWMSYTLFTK